MKVLKKTGIILVIILLSLVLILTVPLPRAKRIETPKVEPKDLIFPRDFFWGAATSGHQVEGGQHNDWTEWEQKNAPRLAAEAERKFGHLASWPGIQAEATNPQNYISGSAADAYNLYSEDITIMQELGLNSYRFSIEWARIEPEENIFDEEALEHYQNLILALRAAGIEPFVTLWHRSQPVWIAEQGDWENKKTIRDFVEYAKYVSLGLGLDITYYMTFNEPELHISAGYLTGVIPPEIKSIKRGLKAFDHMMEGHRQAYDAIHRIDSEAQVGSTHAMQLGSGAPNTLANILIARYLDSYANWKFLDKTIGYNDFIGIQYYAPIAYKLEFGKSSLINVATVVDPISKLRTDMGWGIYPHGIYNVIKETYTRYNKPIIITENGIADQDDKLRSQFITDHLYWVSQAIKVGIPVQGYLYWSLLDNFEWDKGFWPRFGLVQVDYQNNFQRTIRPSAYVYRDIILKNKHP